MASKTQRATGARTKEAAETTQGVETSSVAEAPLSADTYTRTFDGATMIQIAPHSYLNAAHLAIGSGRSRAT